MPALVAQTKDAHLLTKLPLRHANGQQGQALVD
jgi:hypothetical protein